MIELYKTESDCCGCSACEAICPRHNIVMRPNKDGGYMYPLYLGDENCINCKLCLAVCPLKAKNSVKERMPRAYYAGISNDNAIWETSTSGGAFSEIINLYKDNNPVVFGARWGENFDVIMDYTEDIKKTSLFRKSKYVSAKLNGLFPVVKKYLENGRLVIWGGTPCQVNGLKLYLKKEYENLITIDFACHGQGSPDVFKAWIDYLGKKYGSPVRRFKFRERKYIKDHYNSNCTGYELEDGRNILVTRDYYHHSFVYGWHMRKSCQDCDFPENRMSDITLADFKSEEGKSMFEGGMNASDILANTSKGMGICERLKNSMNLYTPSYELELVANPKVAKKIPGNPSRDQFMKDFYDGMPVDRVIKKYARILPSQWIDYNLSEWCYHLLLRPFTYFDEIYKIIIRLFNGV